MNFFFGLNTEVDRQFKAAIAQLNPCLPAAFLKQAHPELSGYLKDIKSSAILAALPYNNPKKAIGHMISYNMVRFCLDFLCESRELIEDSEVNKLYQPLYDAAGCERSVNFDNDFYFNRPLGEFIKKHVDICREYISTLPNYILVIGKIKKYLQLYVGLQSCKFQPFKLRQEKLAVWSNYYIRQFPDISIQEFCTLADSLLGVQAMFSAAADYNLDENGIKALEHAYSPWTCSLHKMLQYYTTAREDIMLGRINFADYYSTLKECEERLIFLMKKSLEFCSELGNPEYHRALVILLAAVNLSDSRAQFGLNKLASHNILDSAPLESKFLVSCCKLFRIGR